MLFCIIEIYRGCKGMLSISYPDLCTGFCKVLWGLMKIARVRKDSNIDAIAIMVIGAKVNRANHLKG